MISAGSKNTGQGMRSRRMSMLSNRNSNILAVMHDSEPSAEYDEKADWLSNYADIENTRLGVSNDKKQSGSINQKSNISAFGINSHIEKSVFSQNSGDKRSDLNFEKGKEDMKN